MGFFLFYLQPKIQLTNCFLKLKLTLRMNNKKSMKAIALFMVLAVMMLLPTAGNAQSYNDVTAESQNGDAFYEIIALETYLDELIAYETYLDELANVIKISEFGNRSGEWDFTVNTQDFDTPLGSGVAMLIGAGLGYAAIKRRKEDEQ